jgi:ribose transport system substrate-binding protein
LLTVAALVIVSFLVAACGSSKSSSSGSGSSSTAAGSSSASSTSTSGGSSASGGVTAAKALVAKYANPSKSEFVAPGPAVKASSLKGKQLWYIPVSAEIPVLQIEAEGIKQAAKALGMSYHTCDGKGEPADSSACITQAVNAGAAGIITDSIDPTTVATSVSYAEKKHVPIVSSNEIVPHPTRYLQFSTNGDVQSEPVAADWIIAQSNGKATVLAGVVTGDPHGTVYAEKQFTSTLKANCPSCTLDSVGEPTPQLSQLPSAVSSALLQHSDVTYAFAQFDFLEPLVAKGVQTAGKHVPIVSTNAVLSDLQAVKSGSQAVDIGANRNYTGWEETDRLVRMMLGKSAPTKTIAPIRVFDKSNIGSISLTNAASFSGIWWGPLTYRQDFEKLWGI